MQSSIPRIIQGLMMTVKVILMNLSTFSAKAEIVGSTSVTGSSNPIFHIKFHSVIFRCSGTQVVIVCVALREFQL